MGVSIPRSGLMPLFAIFGLLSIGYIGKAKAGALKGEYLRNDFKLTGAIVRGF